MRPVLVAVVLALVLIGGVSFAVYRWQEPPSHPNQLGPSVALPAEDPVCKQLRGQLEGLGVREPRLAAGCGRWSAAKRLCVMSARTAPNALECIKLPDDLGRAPGK